MASIEPRGPRQIWRALTWSIKGLRAGYRHEASFRLELLLLLVLFPLGLWLGHGAIERVLLTGCLWLMLAAELLNSAIETVIDKISPEFQEFAGRAKDMGSAAVFLMLINAAMTWLLILLPRFF